MQWRGNFNIALCVFFLAMKPAVAEMNCPGSPFVNGPEDSGVGPYDYHDQKARKTYLANVEKHHFSESVESLRKGITGSVGQDISYMLNSFPNHPRALVSMMNIALSKNASLRYGMTRSPECFLDRAVKFRPSDVKAREVLGVYLFKIGDYDEAKKHFEFALRGGYDDPMFHYNFGLLSIKLRNWDAALFHARKAYGAGVPFPGLRRQLEQAGKWN